MNSTIVKVLEVGKAQRTFVCPCDGKVHSSGEMRIKIGTPKQKNGINVCMNCHTNWFNSLNEIPTSQNSGYSSDTKNHTVEIYLSKSVAEVERYWLLEHRFEVKRMGNLVKFTLTDEKNAHTSGKIVCKALENGYCVKVNGKRINGYLEFLEILDRPIPTNKKLPKVL